MTPTTAEPVLLEYPDPDEPGPAASGRWFVNAGDVLCRRYRLERLLAERSGTLTWLARDAPLSRAVLVHVLPAGHPRTDQLLDAARRAAPATDSRFLRVLDATRVDGRPYGALVVCEYAAGRSLELVLRSGPLDELEACWVAREVAEGLVGAHAAGQAHGRLNPDTVLITAAGDVKVVGFPWEAALAGLEAPDAPASPRRDVQALGELLYAGLLGLWPSGAAYGLSGAPLDARLQPVSPAALRASVQPDVAQIADRILRPGATAAAGLTTAAAVSAALGDILGLTDASRSLGRRLRRSASGPASADVDGGDEVTDPVTLAPDAPYAPGRGSLYTPVPPPPRRPRGATGSPTALRREPGRLGFRILLALFAAALVIGLSGVIVNWYEASRAPTHHALTIASIRDFDPKADGGDDTENPGLAKLAADGQVSTVWKTERYGRSAAFNGRKPGVGLLLDLGSAQAVASVTVTVANGKTDLELRVPKNSDPNAAPSLATQNDWRIVASRPGSSGQTTLAVSPAERTRYVLVYLTKLPSLGAGQGFQGAIAEVTPSS